MLPPSATTDQDGRVRFLSPLSAANVSAYRGETILLASPDAPDVEPDGVYQMWRAPSDLKKSAPTFNGVPVLWRHCFIGGDIPSDLVCGTIGTDAMFDGELLSATVTLWSREAIDSLAWNNALSGAYTFDADMTPGEFNGVAYDGVLRNIEARHCALVPSSRSGVGLDGRRDNIEGSMTVHAIAEDRAPDPARSVTEGAGRSCCRESETCST